MIITPANNYYQLRTDRTTTPDLHTTVGGEVIKYLAKTSIFKPDQNINTNLRPDQIHEIGTTFQKMGALMLDGVQSPGRGKQSISLTRVEAELTQQVFHVYACRTIAEIAGNSAGHTTHPSQIVERAALGALAATISANMHEVLHPNRRSGGAEM